MVDMIDEAKKEFEETRNQEKKERILRRLNRIEQLESIIKDAQKRITRNKELIEQEK